ncbi:phosphoribosyltransferase family protein [Ramlibacter sp. AN1015]|uniref:ComF family protein n=1 Tax=Ramlibacter sp. AN1015 TaxID=3133428 RepID=UPI0030BA66C9
MLAPWLDAALSRLPARCAICHRWPARPVCDGCVARFAHAAQARCARCARPVPAGVAQCGACLREPPAVAACHCALPYAFPWAGLIARFKFQDEPGWATPLARLMRNAPGIAQALASADLVLPMPLSPRRLAERGFNQSLELARRLAPRERLQARLLLRVRDTVPQSSLARERRHANVRGAFALDPLRPQAVAGRQVVLVDDVMTSGATLQAAAQALLAAGAAGVTAVVLARTASA